MEEQREAVSSKESLGQASELFKDTKTKHRGSYKIKRLLCQFAGGGQWEDVMSFHSAMPLTQPFAGTFVWLCGR